MNYLVINNPHRHRFETNVNGHIAVLNYKQDGRSITFLHTEVPQEFAGRGVGSALAKAGLNIFVINILIGVLIIAVDQVCSHLNHSLRYFRISAERSRRRVRALGIKSDDVDRFVRALWMDPQIELTFRNRWVRSVELTVEALDVLSQTAARYGRRGRKVFLTNQEPIVDAMELIQSTRDRHRQAEKLWRGAAAPAAQCRASTKPPPQQSR